MSNTYSGLYSGPTTRLKAVAALEGIETPVDVA